MISLKFDGTILRKNTGRENEETRVSHRRFLGGVIEGEGGAVRGDGAGERGEEKAHRPPPAPPISAAAEVPLDVAGLPHLHLPRGGGLLLALPPPP